jgi:hypothetical protein
MKLVAELCLRFNWARTYGTFWGVGTTVLTSVVDSGEFLAITASPKKKEHPFLYG